MADRAGGRHIAGRSSASLQSAEASSDIHSHYWAHSTYLTRATRAFLVVEVFGEVIPHPAFQQMVLESMF